MKAILVVSNLQIFVEEMSVVKQNNLDRCDLFYTTDPAYVKKNEIKESLKLDIDNLNLGLKFIEFEALSENKEWDYVIHTSSIYEESSFNIIKELKGKRFLVEDGTYDYCCSEPKHQEYLKKSELYLYMPEKALAVDCYLSVNKIEKDIELFDRIVKSYTENSGTDVFDLPKFTPVFFSTPLTDFNVPDYGSKVAEFLDKIYGDSDIIIKKHPRDVVDYPTKRCRIHECPRNLPGQFLYDYMSGDKIFSFPGTIIFGREEEAILVEVLGGEDEYHKACDSVEFKKRFFVC
jgi:hypothetical protein